MILSQQRSTAHITVLRAVGKASFESITQTIKLVANVNEDERVRLRNVLIE